jgi:hypothetical protein
MRMTMRMDSPEHRLTGHSSDRDSNSPTACNTNPTDSVASRGWVKLRKFRSKRNQVDRVGRVNDPDKLDKLVMDDADDMNAT